MDIPLNANVECIEGHCGRSTYIVLNPTTQVVTHIVVKADRAPHDEQLVPVDWIAHTTPDMVKLNCTKDELAGQQPFTGTHFVQIDHPPYKDVPYLMWPFTVPITSEMIPVKDQAIPPGELAVHRGAKVEATDGTVGQVDEFLVDEETEHITHLVLGEGYLWDKKEVAIPVSAIKYFGQERIYLNIDKRAVASLPEVPVDRRYELALKVELEKYEERESELEARVDELTIKLDTIRAELQAAIDERYVTLSAQIAALRKKVA